jgi:hypothetical protein
LLQDKIGQISSPTSSARWVTVLDWFNLSSAGAFTRVDASRYWIRVMFRAGHGAAIDSRTGPPPRISNESPEAAANIAENNKFICNGDEEDGYSGIGLANLEIWRSRCLNTSCMHDAANGNPAATKLLMHIFAAIILAEDVSRMSLGKDS